MVLPPPFFSVVIPTLNAQPILDKAISSLLHQTFQNFEIILVDGLSQDDTITWARKLRDERIEVISEKDEGVYDAMNKGIRKAKGEWLYFMGSDDYLWDNDVLYEVAEFIGNGNKVDFVYGDVFSPDLGENYDGEFDWSKLLKKNICHQAIFCKKSVFEKVGIFNPAYTTCGDYDHVIRCFLDKSIRKKYFPRRIAYFGPGGLSIRNRKDPFTRNFREIVISYGWNSLPESVLRTLYKGRKAYYIDRFKRLLYFPPPDISNLI
jgi:glycosyltransferase involved in cell wall biosynthesis